MNTLSKKITSLIVVALSISAIGIGVISAQEDDTTPPEGKRGHRGAKIEALAEASGLTTEDVQQFFEDGGTVEEFAEENGIDLEALRAEMQAERVAEVEAHIQEALENGDITQEQADEMLERLANGEFPEGRGRGGRGRGGRDGFGRGNAPDAPPVDGDTAAPAPEGNA
jgi:hypothetical protein